MLSKLNSKKNEKKGIFSKKANQSVIKKSGANSNIKLIENEKYFAVYYVTGWYFGRVLQVLADQCSIKFLKLNLDNNFWPKVNEV